MGTSSSSARATEVKPEQKHHLRTDHKHRSRDDYKGKNKSERRPRKSGGHKKKERVVVARICDSGSCRKFEAVIFGA
jgi:hypothetical protein